MATISSIDGEKPGESAAVAAVRPCLDDVVTEDGAPVDNMFSEKQFRLLTEPLFVIFVR